MAATRKKAVGLLTQPKQYLISKWPHAHPHAQSARNFKPIRCHATTANPVQDRSFQEPDPPPSSDPASVASRSDRLQDIKSAKPFSSFLTDTFNRQHDYLRISITEKCNLRCLYCMPAEGVPLSPKRHLLTPAEILYISSLFVSQGVTKIRLTGGEPTVHPQILPLLRDIGSLRSSGLRELALTTNGLTLSRKLDSMVESGVTGINLSLDTLDPFQFEIMTRRRGFEQVMKSIDRMLDMKRLGASLKLKVNAVIIRGLNDAQIIPFVELTRDKDIEIRFIEYMPFDGNKWSSQKMMSYQEMLAVIREQYPTVEKVLDHPNDTSKTFKIPGFEGRIGFITSMTENFCGSCNRLRITSDGNLKVCLFGNAEVSLRDILRKNFNDGEPIDEAAWESMKQVEMDRKEGRSEGDLGFREKEMELLDIIGMAVKRKKARHAGIGVLEHMKNRPMILIDDSSFPRSPSLPCQRSIPVEGSLFPLKGRPTNRPMYASYAQLISATARSLRPLQLISQFCTSLIRLEKGDASTHNLKPKAHNKLTHLNTSGEAHMVQIPPPQQLPSSEHVDERSKNSGSYKPVTTRTAKAVARVNFSNSEPYRLIHAALQPPSPNNSTSTRQTPPKGDVIATARIAGIMAAKRTADLIPLCHNVPLAGVSVDVDLIPPAGSPKAVSTADETAIEFGGVAVAATVTAHAQTGVEMEALTAANVAGLTVYDMCKAVDRGMSMSNVRVVFKSGGRSGTWGDKGVKI